MYNNYIYYINKQMEVYAINVINSIEVKPDTNRYIIEMKKYF